MKLKIIFAITAMSAYLHANTAVAAQNAPDTETAEKGRMELGLSALWTPTPYDGQKQDIWPVPVINYDDDNFFIKGLSAGAYLWKDRHDQLTVNMYYSTLHFDPDDESNHALNSLDKRKSTLMSGVGYQHRAAWGVTRFNLAMDTLGRSNGLVGDAAWLYPLHYNQLELKPGVGVTWENGNSGRYYYGISQAESTRSGLKAYSPGSTWSPYASLSALYHFTPTWTAFASVRYTHLASDLKDSPMVDKSGTGMFWTGVTYNF